MDLNVHHSDHPDLEEAVCQSHLSTLLEAIAGHVCERASSLSPQGLANVSWEPWLQNPIFDLCRGFSKIVGDMLGLTLG